MSPRPLNEAGSHAWKNSTLAWLAVLLLAVLSYFLGLNGQYVPTNGDELVYSHIARLTAASGHWLPLVSDLDHMRNTKPPLLFWQAMVAGNWGQQWTMAALRMPSVIYTMLISAAVGWTVMLISGDLRRALLATCIYLAFFCTFRYGRTYLTSAPETFWLNVPMFCLLWWQLTLSNKPLPSTPTVVADAPGQRALGWLTHLGFGLAMGIGLTYKSFALIAPAAATLWCAQLMNLSPSNWRGSLNITMKVALSALIALGIFGLWFVFDPDPKAVWQEFVLGENAGKLSNSAGYWQTALFGGGFSIWAQLFGYAQNAGLLAFVVIGLMVLGLQHLLTLRQRSLRSMPIHLSTILVWLAVWLLVFTLPSQRSARYLIPAMPALAIMLALLWERIGRGWFVPSLVLNGLVIGFLGRISWAEYEMGISNASELSLTLLAVGCGFALVFAGLGMAAWTRACTLTATLTVFVVFGLTTAPLNGSSGLYSEQVISTLKENRIAVPSSFNGQFERFEFLLPGNRFWAYDGDARLFRSKAENLEALQQLLETNDAVVWLQTRDEVFQPLCTPACIVLGSRWEVRGRHKSGEINLTNIWHPEQWLFRREWLLTRVKNEANAESTPARRRPAK
jgi:4-amino-4-deoxy-L-arabinose transferase-like glycosyltransferase